MARYIDADALIEAIKHELWDWKTLDSITSTTVLKQTITDIKNTPTADVVERKTGTWIFEDRKPVNRKLKTNEFAYCDQCGGTAPGYPFWEVDLELTKFCPHCGARML